MIIDEKFRSKFSFRRNTTPKVINGVELTGLKNFNGSIRDRPKCANRANEQLH